MTPRELLEKGASRLGVALTGEQMDKLLRYKDELGKWNRKINLTAIVDDREVIIKHFLDSLSYLKGFDPFPGLRLLDMGSGAGFPALPIKIARPQITVALVESVGKKAAFLRHIQRTLSLPSTEVLDRRTEEVDAGYENTYNIVTARAFADMDKALAAGVRFLKADGLMVLSRGPEEAIGEEPLRRMGMALARKIDLKLPCSDNERAIWVFRKAGTDNP